MKSFDPSTGAIFIKSGNQIDKVKIADIFAIEAEGNSCMIHTSDKTYIQRFSLVRLKERLLNFDFIQVNKSTMLPIYKIDHVDLSGNTIYLEGKPYYLSRTFRKAFIEGLRLL